MSDTPGDLFDLDRFVKAQAPIYERVRAELGAGQKQSHWMWFVFPQLQGLGSSPRAVYYGIRSLKEARAYLAHPILGPRLDEATRLVLAVRDRSLQEIFGSPDDAKFRSSMTLFARAAEPGSLFEEALATSCAGADERTDALLKRAKA
jgi:uncharacterized protein (DUF1810 family)